MSKSVVCPSSSLTRVLTRPKTQSMIFSLASLSVAKIRNYIGVPDETDPSYIFLSGDIGDAVATALTAANGRDVLVLGANIVNQCIGRRRGSVVRCLGASGLARDARRVGIRSGCEPALASRQGGRMSTPYAWAFLMGEGSPADQRPLWCEAQSQRLGAAGGLERDGAVSPA
jgi:hypothetical protein